MFSKEMRHVWGEMYPSDPVLVIMHVDAQGYHIVHHKSVEFCKEGMLSESVLGAW